MLLSISIPAHADPSDWRTPEADANFAGMFSEKEINSIQEVLPPSEDLTRAIESKRAIASLLSKNPDYIYNLAAKVCDQMAIGTPQSILASSITKGVIESKAKVKLHPLAARYFGLQVVNVANRYYCPSL